MISFVSVAFFCMAFLIRNASSLVSVAFVCVLFPQDYGFVGSVGFCKCVAFGIF